MADPHADAIDRPRVHRAPISRRRRRIFVAVLCLGPLLLAEIAARVAVRWRWSADRIEALTHHGAVRGLYQLHPNLPYVLRPIYESNNSLGFRGPEISVRKPAGLRRVVCIGSSTTYGIYVKPEETHAARLEALLRADGYKCEVVNAGVPGWVSSECLINLQLRILPLRPDLVVIYEGRNDLFPQYFNNFQPDYSHYRRADYDMASTNYLYKPLFRLSNLFMIVATYKGNRLGWSWRDENPIYGCIRFENEPTPEQIIANLADPVRTEPYRRNLEAMIALCRLNDCKVLLCTMAFRAEKLRTGGFLYADRPIHAALTAQVQENNDAMREVARRMGVPVAETAALEAEPTLFLDECHFGAEGHAKRAHIIQEAIVREGMLK